MGYCTVGDLVPLLSELELLQLADDSVDRSGTMESADVLTVLAEAIEQAGREIDAYASAAGLAVPLAPVPPLAADLAAKLAVYNLFVRRGQRNEAWDGEAARCRRLLENVAKGVLRFGAPEADATAPADSPSGITVSAPPAQFGPGAWEKY